MALEYDLYLEVGMQPKQAFEMLASRVPGLARSEEGFWLVDETATITVAGVLASRKDVIGEAFRFFPAVRVGFRFVNDTDYDRFRQIMLEAVLLLLEQAQDAVLLFNGETIVLQRFGGKLVLNSDYHIFEDDDWLRSRFTLPFERRPLPSPLM